MTVQKDVLVGIENEKFIAKSTTKKSATQNARMIKNQTTSKSVTLTNAQSGKLACGMNAQKHVVVEHSTG